MSLNEILSQDDDFSWHDVLNYANYLESQTIQNSNQIITSASSDNLPVALTRKECKHWTENEHKYFSTKLLNILFFLVPNFDLCIPCLKNCILFWLLPNRLFVLGLVKHERNWKEISNNFVPSKTSSQIASHAQKYFIRQNISKEEKKRKSIHDITLQEIVSDNVPSYINQNLWDI